MDQSKRVRYVKVDRGRFFYQRRIPKHLHDVLEETKWQRRCGNVSYAKAVQMIVGWTEEHDALISRSKTPDGLARIKAELRSEMREFEDENFAGTQKIIAQVDIVSGQIIDGDWAECDWKSAKQELSEIDNLRNPTRPPKSEHAQILAKIHRANSGKKFGMDVELPPYPEYQRILQGLEAESLKARIRLTANFPTPIDDLEYADLLTTLLKDHFFTGQEKPLDGDERDDYELIKRKIERRLSECQPDPMTITKVAERYFAFNGIKTATAAKYRREIQRLVKISGDVPVQHVTISQLKELRDNLVTQIKPASVHAVFTPIKGMFAYAMNEQIIETNPTHSISLPRDKRPLEERKWKKFEPIEVSKIYQSMYDFWGSPNPNLTDERRMALLMLVKVLMFSGMRPIEALRLKPSDVTDRSINIHGSKTESSTRVVPLHPELTDFPNWISKGGLDAFDSIKTDKVGSLRHNFTRLIREQMPHPIDDKQKGLYSLRSTFVNAMRRAGADIQMQRAILGHKEAGAIRHYDDGPEFELKYNFVAKTDPRK
jgi:integrase